MAKILMQFRNRVRLEKSQVVTFDIQDTKGKPLGSLELGPSGFSYYKPGKKLPKEISWEDFLRRFST